MIRKYIYSSVSVFYAHMDCGASVYDGYRNALSPTGRRESKTVNGKTTTHHWDGSNIVSEGGENPSVYYRGIHLIGQNDNGGISYYLYNAHGDITGLEGAGARMLSRVEYDAFGGPSKVSGIVFGYNGQYTDRETNLIYLRNRYYDPETGRFTQEDPIKDGINWYVYCGSNPINFVDPWGLESIETYCSNFDELKSEQRKNMNSAITAYNDGFLSKSDMLENLALNGGNIREGIKSAGIVAEMVGNNLNITVYADIESIEVMEELNNGETAKSTYTQKNCNELGDIEYLNTGGITFKDILCSGIEAWSGSVDGVNINVNVVYGKSNTNKTVKVNFKYGNRDKSRASGYSSDIYYTTRQDPNDSSLINLTYLCAHEAGGHSSFNFGDAYSKASGIKNISSVMGEGIQPISDLDRAMLLRAFTNYGFKQHMRYEDNIDLLNKYSPGWSYKGGN